MQRVIVITGASRGIGEACALQFAQPQTKLILLATKKSHLKNISTLCKDKGAQVHCLSLNLADKLAIKTMIQDILYEHGKIDVLINNAGIWIEKPFMSGDMDEWDEALDVNLKGCIHLTRYALEGMSEGSSVVFIASIASRKVYAGGTNYCATKFGLLGFAGSLFEDIREKGIKVSSILPGVVNTDMHKSDDSLIKEKMIQPEDIAHAVSYVVSTPVHICPTELTLMPQKNPRVYNKQR